LITDLQDDAIASALVDLVGERGFDETSAADVIWRSGVTSQEFFRRFADLEACALFSLEILLDLFKARLEQAYAAAPDWRQGMRAVAEEIARLTSEAPTRFRFAMVESLKAKDEMLRVRREDGFIYAEQLIDRGRLSAPDPDAVPRAAAAIIAGSVAQLLARRLQPGADRDPLEIVPQIMFLVVRPYLGYAAACEELERESGAGAAVGDRVISRSTIWAAA
jgi:AcrR family transcriptional regulator